MTQRNYANERYRKDAKIGSTRKSAAKAKPVRKQGSGVSSGAAKAAADKKAAEKKAAGKGTWKLPTSPEIDKWRKVWWVALGIAIAAFGLAFWANETGNDSLARVGLALELSGAFTAIYIDWFIIRKLRKQLMDGASGKKSGKDAS